MLKPVTFNTNGTGYWSPVATAVEIVDMQLGYVNDEGDFGELRVMFNTKTWNVEHDGLIYTDKQFISDLREFCNVQGLDGNDVDYSEQGMQGDNYVSCDVGKAFLDSWGAKFGVDSIGPMCYN
jgi:hypothetical protein